MTLLLRTRIVLELTVEPHFANPLFVHPEDRTHSLEIDTQVWKDLGSPREITVTIEPGNTL